MQWMNTVKVAWKAIFTNKSRSLLTMLGVIIGVGSVILLTSIGTGIQKFIEQQFEDLGANTILVYPFQIFGEGGQPQTADDRLGEIAGQQFSERELRDIGRLRSEIVAYMPESSQRNDVSWRNTTEVGTIVGTSEAYAEVRNTATEKGRFFDEQEAGAGMRVAVLGSEIAEEVFGDVDPVNKDIRIGETTFTVVGVAESKGGGFGGPSFDRYVMIPLEAYFRMFDTRDVNSISLKVRDKEDIPVVIDTVEEYLLTESDRDDDEFDVFDQTEILDTINQILGVLTLGLGGIAAISLVVGGIGIMNIMLVSVTERTREIGLRKALGATPDQILLQFLIESSLLSFIGGAIGVGLAALLSLALVIFADFPSAITIPSVALAFGVSFLVGIVFGVAPARKASRLSPIEALRSE